MKFQEISSQFYKYVILFQGIYDEYTTGDGYGDGDYAYDGYPGTVLNWPKIPDTFITFILKLRKLFSQ